MKTKLFAGSIAATLMLASLMSAETPRKQPAMSPAMSEDMRRAIAFERYKDLAAARQARKEAIQPSVTYSNADRSADRAAEDATQGKKVIDAGPGAKKDKL